MARAYSSAAPRELDDRVEPLVGQRVVGRAVRAEQRVGGMQQHANGEQAPAPRARPCGSSTVHRVRRSRRLSSRNGRHGRSAGAVLAEQVLGGRPDERGGAGSVGRRHVPLQPAHDRPRVCATPCRARGRPRRRPGRRSRSTLRAARARPRRRVRASRRAARDRRCRSPRRTGRGARRGRTSRRSRPPARPAGPRAARGRCASGSRGSMTTRSGAPAFEASTPAFAQTKPWRVRQISTPRSARRIAALSSSTTCTRARVLAVLGGERRGRAPSAAPAASSTSAPSAFETTLWATTSTSPRSQPP